MDLKKNHSIDSLFSLLLLLIFTLFAMMLSAMGAKIYQNGVSHLNENYTSRTAIAYVTEKVHQHDKTDSIFLSEVEGVPAIAFRDEMDGQSFITYVYLYEDALRELFVRESTEPQLILGTSLMELADFQIECEAKLFKVTAVSHEGNSRSVYLSWNS